MKIRIADSLQKSQNFSALALSLLLALASTTAGVAPPVMAAQTAELYQAEQLKNKGQLREALKHANTAVMMDANNPDAIYLRAAIYNQMDLQKPALKDLDKLIKMRPTMWRAYALRGDTYVDAREYEKAIADINTALKLAPRPTSFMFYTRAQAYNALGQTDKSLADFKTVIELATKENDKDRLHEAYMYRGQVLYNSGDYKKAVEDLTQAITIGGLRDELILQRASAYEKLGQYDLAIADYSKLLSVNPEDESAYEKRGRLYLAAKKFDKALSDANKAISNYPGENPSRLYKFRAEVYQKMGKADLANKDLLKAKELEREQL